MVLLDRRGHLPTTLLFFAALAFFAVTLYAFVTYSKATTSQAEDATGVFSDAVFQQAYVYRIAEFTARENIRSFDSSGNLREDFMKLINERDRGINLGNFFGKARNGDFTFEKKEKKYRLEFQGLFVQAERGTIKLKRNFNLTLEFDGDKVYKELMSE